VIHPRHPDTRHALPDAGLTVLLIRVTVQGDMNTGDIGVQEYKGSGVQEYQMSDSSIIIMSKSP